MQSTGERGEELDPNYIQLPVWVSAAAAVVPCRAVLCCAVQCSAVQCFALLCCAVLCRAVLCCAVQCSAVLCCAVLCCAVLCCLGVQCRQCAAASCTKHTPAPTVNSHSCAHTPCVPLLAPLRVPLHAPLPLLQEGSRYSEMKPELMIQPADVAEAALLPLALSPAADPVEVVLNRLQTPYKA